MSKIMQISSFSSFVEGEASDPIIDKDIKGGTVDQVISLTPLFSKEEIKNAGICGKFIEQVINGVYFTFACPSTMIYCSIANVLSKPVKENTVPAAAPMKKLSEEDKLGLENEIKELKEDLRRMIISKVPVSFQLKKISRVLSAELKFNNAPLPRALNLAIDNEIKGINQEENVREDSLKYIFRDEQQFLKAVNL